MPHLIPNSLPFLPAATGLKIVQNCFVEISAFHHLLLASYSRSFTECKASEAHRLIWGEDSLTSLYSGIFINLSTFPLVLATG